ncbi:MAG: hypothetical protein HFJ50_01630 [Clostridia bacterium]|nr:hypothetical protein [Clostridia bacterium]
MKKAIKISMGQGQVAVLTTEGTVRAWGLNTNGQNGINCTQTIKTTWTTTYNTSYPMKTAKDVTDVSCGAWHTVVKKLDGSIYSTGYNEHGSLGNETNTLSDIYVEAKLPKVGENETKVKYIKAGILNTSILLSDGTVWETGYGVSGELRRWKRNKL